MKQAASRGCHKKPPWETPPWETPRGRPPAPSVDLLVGLRDLIKLLEGKLKTTECSGPHNALLGGSFGSSFL